MSDAAFPATMNEQSVAGIQGFLNQIITYVVRFVVICQAPGYP
ncbi:MAG: hypothetical protein WA888_18610 [Burkholderiaceae bacterium]